MRHVTSTTGILVVAGLFFGLVSCHQGPDQVRTIFTVEGMHCDACSTSIVTTLEKIGGVHEASADHETGVAEATYRPRMVEVDRLKAEIEKLGYTVIGVETVAVDS
jgi:copper chaperone CopZ